MGGDGAHAVPIRDRLPYYRLVHELSKDVPLELPDADRVVLAIERDVRRYFEHRDLNMHLDPKPDEAEPTSPVFLRRAIQVVEVDGQMRFEEGAAEPFRPEAQWNPSNFASLHGIYSLLYGQTWGSKRTKVYSDLSMDFWIRGVVSISFIEANGGRLQFGDRMATPSEISATLLKTIIPHVMRDTEIGKERGSEILDDALLISSTVRNANSQQGRYTPGEVRSIHEFLYGQVNRSHQNGSLVVTNSLKMAGALDLLSSNSR